MTKAGAPSEILGGIAGDLSTDIERPEVALAIAAHPDDIEFGCGATLAKWASAGTRIVHVICTDGAKGTWDPDADLTALVTRRQAEQRAASVALGGTGMVAFLSRVDGELSSDIATRGEVAEIIRRHRPEVVLGHDPWKRYRLHPDHRHAGWLCVDGVVAARDPHFFPEQGLAPHRPTAMLLFEADQVNHVEVIDEDALERRCDALVAHRSQWETTHLLRAEQSGEPMGSKEEGIDGFRRRERRLLSAMGSLVGAPLGEAFRLMDDL